jgi:hypothetical protein
MATVIDGSASVTINSGAVLGITSGTAVASTSGTSIDFTGIPSWVKRITVQFAGVSTSGTANILVQIGSGSVDISGYLSAAYQTLTPASALSTAGFLVFNNAAADTTHGSLVLTFFNGNIWTSSGTLYKDAATDYLFLNAGTRTLAGVLDRVRITTSNGTDTFDAGSINIMYEG